MSKFQNDSIFWIEVEKIKPNPYQPRKEFSDDKLNHLAESVRQYGILQPLVVTRYEVEKADGGLVAEYELIAGERRLRASKIAGLTQVPVIIRTGEEDKGMKLELAIIENLQREDLNPIDRAMAFQRLVDEFNFKHSEIAKKVGKSREYVSNSLRLLNLPEEIIDAITHGQITEGHARPILMLKDKPEEQNTLFKEIIYRKLTVRDAEAIARKVAHDRVRKKPTFDPEIDELEVQLAESLGTRVQIERKDVGGKVMIDFFSNEDLKNILDLIHSNEKKNSDDMLNNYISKNEIIEDIPETKEEESMEFAEDDTQKTIEPVIGETVVDEISDTPDNVVMVGSDFMAPKESLGNNSDISDGFNSVVLENNNVSETEEINNITQGPVVNEGGSIKIDEGIEVIPGVPDFSNEINQSVNNEIQQAENAENTFSSEQDVVVGNENKSDEDTDLYSVKDFSI